MQCYNSKRNGHFQKDCWFLEKNKNKRPAPNSQKRNAHGSDDDNALVVIAETSLSSTFSSVNKSSWLLDSGATSHMCDNRQLFENYENLENAIPIRLGDGHVVYGIGRGKIAVLAFNGNYWVEWNLINVLHVPKIKINLFSMGSALAKGIRLESTNFQYKFYVSYS